MRSAEGLDVAGGQWRAVIPWATTLSTIVMAIVFTADEHPGSASPSSSTASSAKTTEANPRGPNQPTKLRSRGPAGTENAIATGTIRTSVRLSTA